MVGEHPEPVCSLSRLNDPFLKAYVLLRDSELGRVSELNIGLHVSTVHLVADALLALRRAPYPQFPSGLSDALETL
jgi:hypothetical protein